MAKEKEKAYLILSDGTVYEGQALGVSGTVTAEVVFNTDMVGYMETLTNKDNKDKIVVKAFPLIGCYGVIKDEMLQDNITVKGFVVRECCDKPSNAKSSGGLEDFLKQKGVVAIQGIDTRSVVRKIRDSKKGLTATITNDKKLTTGGKK